MKVGKDYVQKYRNEQYKTKADYFMEETRLNAVRKLEKRLLILCDKHARMPLTGAKIHLANYIDSLVLKFISL